ncbi:MAG: GH36 C-terminal domain-containing protein [Candidatus Cryptobacteroides sp.]
MFVSPDQSEAVFFAYKFKVNADNRNNPRFRFDGLDPDASYRLAELNRTGDTQPWEGQTFTGRFLMNTGLELPMIQQYSSRVIRLDRLPVQP